MKEFDKIRKEWQLPLVKPEKRASQVIKEVRQTGKNFSQRSFWSGMGLLLIFVYLLVFSYQKSADFSYPSSEIALYLLASIVLLQAMLNFFNYRDLKKIDVAALPATMLKSWLFYYHRRLRYIRYNLPLYNITLNAAFALYLPEVLVAYPSFGYRIAFVLIYLSLMGLLWRFFFKRLFLNEKQKLQELINSLEALSHQWKQTE